MEKRSNKTVVQAALDLAVKELDKAIARLEKELAQLKAQREAISGVGRTIPDDEKGKNRRRKTPKKFTKGKNHISNVEGKPLLGTSYRFAIRYVLERSAFPMYTSEIMAEAKRRGFSKSKKLSSFSAQLTSYDDFVSLGRSGGRHMWGLKGKEYTNG